MLISFNTLLEFALFSDKLDELLLSQDIKYIGIINTKKYLNILNNHNLFINSSIYIPYSF